MKHWPVLHRAARASCCAFANVRLRCSVRWRSRSSKPEAAASSKGTSRIKGLSEIASVYLLPSTANCRTAPIVIGLINALEKKTPNVAYFRIVEERLRHADVVHTSLVKDIFNIKGETGLSYQSANRMMERGDIEDLQDKALAHFTQLQQRHDFVVVEGHYFEGHSDDSNYELNVGLAKSIGAPVVLVHDVFSETLLLQASTKKQMAEAILSPLLQRLSLLRVKRAPLLGVVLNRVPGGRRVYDEVAKRFESQGLDVPLLGGLPFDRQLTALEMRDIAEALDARVLCADEALDNTVVQDNVRIFSGYVLQIWQRLQRNPLLAVNRHRSVFEEAFQKRSGREERQMIDRHAFAAIYKKLPVCSNKDDIELLFNTLDADGDGYLTPSDVEGSLPRLLYVLAPDRLDAVLSLLALSTAPEISGCTAGVLVTGTKEPKEIKEALSLLSAAPVDRGRLPLFPVLSTELDVTEALMALDGVPSRLRGGSRKVHRAMELFQEHVPLDHLYEAISKPYEHVTTKMFLHMVATRAREKVRHVVVGYHDNDRVLKAAEEVYRRGLCELILLGDADSIREKLTQMQINLPDLNIVEPGSSKKFDEYVEHYVKTKHEGEDGVIHDANEVMGDVDYFGAMMVARNDADAMVTSIQISTSSTVRSAREIIPHSSKLLSSVFFMCLEKEVLVYGDCALNANPTAEELALIAATSADTAQALGISPRVAMLSYATGDSNEGPIIDKVIEATKRAREIRPDLPIFGPTQYDAAVDPVVAKTKVKGESYGVAGRATVLVFPNLNVGNNTYKAVQQSTRGGAIGPIIQGLSKPVNEISRGATVDDIVNTIAITAAMCK